MRSRKVQLMIIKLSEMNYVLQLDDGNERGLNCGLVVTNDHIYKRKSSARRAAHKLASDLNLIITHEED